VDKRGPDTGQQGNAAGELPVYGNMEQGEREDHLKYAFANVLPFDQPEKSRG
jgi:hypothetical protein